MDNNWYEIFGLGRHQIPDVNPTDMLRIPNHVFLKIRGGGE